MGIVEIEFIAGYNLGIFIPRHLIGKPALLQQTKHIG